MKKLLSLSLILLGFISLQAQESKDFKKHRHHKMVKAKKQHHQKMMHDIDFTEAQKAQLKVVNENHRKKMQELHKNENITVKEQRERRSAIQQNHRENVQQILTSDQKKQLEQQKQARKEKHTAKRKSHEEKMKTELGLSNEQAAKIAAANKEAAVKLNAIKTDENLSQQQKMEKMRTIKEEQMALRKSILTQEQLNKLKEQRPQHKRMERSRK